jgi:hypothetical protein
MATPLSGGHPTAYPEKLTLVVVRFLGFTPVLDRLLGKENRIQVSMPADILTMRRDLAFRHNGT